MKVRRFEEFSAVSDELVEILRSSMTGEMDSKQAVLLPGGATPVPIYKAIESNPFSASPNACVIISDERYVSDQSDFYNYGKLEPMVNAIGIHKDNIIKVDTSLEYTESAVNFDKRISDFMEDGGVISLAVLGLGSDGHTASLFSRHDIRASEGRYAINVSANDGPDRISVTPELLAQAEKVVILVAGESKTEIVQRLEDTPDEVIAGIALAHAVDVEVWFSKRK
ncbi:hypothetical protein BVX97_06470 [bacterium E08(2017)]|nr:hypothetical protein BVX97_06470 [bacterium E08(2017)]